MTQSMFQRQTAVPAGLGSCKYRSDQHCLCTMSSQHTLVIDPGVSHRTQHCVGTFLRGVLEKVGIEPQVKRIGKYKSAGDQLLLKDMSEPQREQLTALLEDIYEGFTSTIAKDRNKTVEEVSHVLCCL